MAAVTICSDFGAQRNKVWHCFYCFPIYLLWSDGTRCHDLSFLNVKPTFSPSSFTFIKKLFSSSLSAIRVLSSAYLRLLLFLLAILIPACACSSLAFLMMYYAYKLNKQGDNIQPWHTLSTDHYLSLYNTFRCRSLCCVHWSISCMKAGLCLLSSLLNPTAFANCY